jgi:hypothetical protein
MWQAIPFDLKMLMATRARQLWQVRGALLVSLVTSAFPLVWQGMPVLQALSTSAQRLGIPRKPAPGYLGPLTKTRVQQYQGRQLQRMPADRRKRAFRTGRY